MICGLEEFKVYLNLCRNIYDASKPEIFEIGWNNEYLSIILYLDDMIQAAVRDLNIDNAKIELNRTLDLSVKAESVNEDDESDKYEIKAMKTLELVESFLLSTFFCLKYKFSLKLLRENFIWH